MVTREAGGAGLKIDVVEIIELCQSICPVLRSASTVSYCHWSCSLIGPASPACVSSGDQQINSDKFLSISNHPGQC